MLELRPGNAIQAVHRAKQGQSNTIPPAIRHTEGDRADFDNHQGVVRLSVGFGEWHWSEVAAVWDTRGAAPMVLAGEILQVIRKRINGSRNAAVLANEGKLSVIPQ